MSRTIDNLELILYGWFDALRRSQPELIAPRLAADIVWQGLRPDLVCTGRDEVLTNIGYGGELRHHVKGLQVDALDEDHVLSAVRLHDVTELFGEPIAGELYSIFTLRDDLITRIDEFKTKDDALATLHEANGPASTQPA
jgi:hypothetical protein